MKNKQVKQMICASLRDHYDYCEVSFTKGVIIGEGVDGGYFSHTIKFKPISLTANQLKGN